MHIWFANSAGLRSVVLEIFAPTSNRLVRKAPAWGPAHGRDLWGRFRREAMRPAPRQLSVADIGAALGCTQSGCGFAVDGHRCTAGSPFTLHCWESLHTAEYEPHCGLVVTWPP